jgi:hypothetical protein
LYFKDAFATRAVLISDLNDKKRLEFKCMVRFKGGRDRLSLIGTFLRRQREIEPHCSTINATKG